EVEVTKYTYKDYMKKIMGLFPLPEKPVHMCHDAFIKKLLAPYALQKLDRNRKLNYEQTDPYEFTFESANEDFLANLYATNYKARATMYMARATFLARQSTDRRSRSVLSVDQRKSAFKTAQMFKTRFRNLISDFRNVCVIYQLVQLQEILNVMREHPPEGTDPNNTIFVWCYKENLKRFQEQSATVYIDILEDNKSQTTLDDLKFYVDLTEIIRLVRILHRDVVKEKDLCAVHGFMEHLTDTTMDIDKIIGLPYETVMAEHDALVEENQNKQGKFQNPGLKAKQLALKKERFQSDYIMPVETRYRINWTYDKKEQFQFKDDLHCKVFTDELQRLADLTEKDMRVRQSVTYEYLYLIETYKKRINQVQQAYDEDMESAENMVQTTRNRVNKCKEDLKLAIDKVEMFRRKTKEVRDKIAEEKEAERARLSAVR
ncbi:hypothetical protein KR067_013550, partial [Drosophila pandora]